MPFPAQIKPWTSLIAAIMLCVGAGMIGGSFRPGEWYSLLQKPPGTPPDWVFAPVWTTLFVLMGIALWRWLRGPCGRPLVLLFMAQLSLNVLWSALFFGIEEPGWALLEMVVLWLTIAALIIHGHHHDRLAAWLLVPYLAWVSYALYLNAGIVWLN